ncbi:MAG TPA: protein kinase [Candidatus Angelobacter sp.]|nr:protein kinase [Candidatus Angelobacter sp.]
MMMDPIERDDCVMTLTAEALKTPPSERDNFLQSACRDDPELYRQVSEVVTWEERMSGFLSRPLIEFIDLGPLDKILEPGQLVPGRFEILRCVGEGGMGVVYEAFDRKRKQRIAIKFAKSAFGPLLSPELEGALKVRHPNICVVNEIHTTATESGYVDFLTMEFLDGETLASRLARGKLEKVEAWEIARQLCAGVAEAHRSGILHRDLKPGNVILCQKQDSSTRAVITDFGLSTESAVASEIEGGTPSYLAPELSYNGKASQASDIFSLGIILYEMTTGRKPFPAMSEGDRTFCLPVAPGKLVRNLPHRWDAAILSALQAKPEKRCSAEQLLDALERKPFYRRPALMVATVACLILAAMVVPRIVDMFSSPPMRLAVLPVGGPSGPAQRGERILQEVAERVRRLQAGKATVSVILPSKALSKGVTTPEQAKRVFGATHTLQLKLRPDADGLMAEGTVIDLGTMTHREYSAHFAEANLVDLPTGLTGFISWALHIHRAKQPDSVVPAAVIAYKSGRDFLDREPHDFIDAIREFEEAARLDPHSPLPLAGLAEAYSREYQFQRDEKARKEAQLWLAKAEALNADSPTVRMASGLLHLIRGDYLRALDDYQRVEEIEPGNVEAWLGSGLAYESQGMLDKAMKDYGQAIFLEPSYYKPYEYLGALHYYHGQYAEAEEAYQKDIEYAPDRVNAYGSLVGVYTAQFKYAEAEKVYKSLLERKQTALTLNNIGAMLAFQGRQREAIDYYRQAVDKDPNRAIYWLNLGDAQRRMDEHVDAKDSYQHGLRLALSQVTANEGNTSARAYLAYLQARLGFKDQASLQIAAALNSPAKDDQVIRCAVETYEAMGDREQALAAAAMATVQTRMQMDHHPDLADLQRDSRFRSLIGQK